MKEASSQRHNESSTPRFVRQCPTAIASSGWECSRTSHAPARHFRLLIPITVGLIFLLLWATFQSFRAGLLVLAGIPFACIGGILALYIRDMHMNVSTGVGFAALFGIAIMDGVLMVRGITVFRQQGVELAESIVQGALGRLRPILITAIVAIFGLLPASIGNRAGLGRAASSGHGDRLGAVQFHDLDAFRRARVLRDASSFDVGSSQLCRYDGWSLL